jgi:signal transduction histidine kinase
MVSSLQSVDELVTEVLAATRSLTAELSPSILQTGRFSEALEWLAAWVEQKHGLKVHVEADASIDLPEEARAMLFLAARELLFNVVKHAAVQQATLQLFRAEGQEVRIVVADKGAGFDPLQHSQGRNHVSGFGLRSMRERLELVGGRMEVDAAPGRGTRVMLAAPQGRLPLPTVPP